MAAITIITPVYNGSAYIAEVVESVLAQDFQDFVYICIDDGSTDDTLAVLRRYQDRVTVLTHPNQGEPATVNKGVDMAATDLILIVNADDPIKPGLLRQAVERMQAAGNDLVAVYPDWDMIDSQGHVIKTVRTLDYDYRVMLEQCLCLPGPGTVFRKSALAGEPVRDRRFKYSSDYELWLRLGLKGRMERIPEILATWRFHDAGASQAARNPEMAANKVDVVRAFYRRRDIPAAIRRIHRQTLSTAYYCAGCIALYNPRIPGRRYFLRCLLLAPLWPRHFQPERKRLWLPILFVMFQPFSARALGVLQKFGLMRNHTLPARINA